MIPSDRAGARHALQQGRAVYVRLDQIRGPEDAAADIVDLWGAAESAMRAMLGGSMLHGQALVRELRQRGMLDLDQANALASFWDARSRIESVNYKPTLTDVGHARAGYNHLVEAVESGQESPPDKTAAASAGPAAPSIEMPVYDTELRSEGRGNGRLAFWVGIAVIVLVVLGAGSYFLMGRSSYDKDMSTAIDAMQRGQTETARAGFTRASVLHPDQAEPHVFLARIARNEGDMATAHRELEAAIRAEPENGHALREMGLLLLAENRASLAASFFVRAIRADTSDAASKGYLGCALIKQNRVDEGLRFLNRAGSGSWSTCATPGVKPASP